MTTGEITGTVDKLIEAGVVTILGLIVLFLAIAFLALILLIIRFFKAFVEIQKSNQEIQKNGQKSVEKLTELTETTRDSMLVLEAGVKLNKTSIDEINIKLDIKFLDLDTKIESLSKDFKLLKEEMKGYKKMNEDEFFKRFHVLLDNLNHIVQEMTDVNKNLVTQDDSHVNKLTEKFGKIKTMLQELTDSVNSTTNKEQP